AWELVQASVKTAAQAQEALRLANVRYGAGTATQLDVLTSQVALTEARLNELQANYGYNVALAAMRQAMGQADEFVKS
ncbi:MAG TPA: TolC family protein, partial [Opitutaceae bacterium]|nr:TolC family protein [Opitutaceae bacterium]